MGTMKGVAWAGEKTLGNVLTGARKIPARRQSSRCWACWYGQCPPSTVTSSDISPQAGSFVVARVSSEMATWSCLILLLSMHLALNHAAVRAVSMRSLNRQRATILMSRFLSEDRVLTPEAVSQAERLFEKGSSLRWEGSPVLAKAFIGVPLQTLIDGLAPTHAATGSTRDPESRLQQLIEIFREEKYLLWFDAPSTTVWIVIREGAAPRSLLQAWTHALLIAHQSHDREATCASAEGTFQLIRSSLHTVSRKFDVSFSRLSAAGWDTEIGSLETASATRLRLSSPEHWTGPSFEGTTGSTGSGRIADTNTRPVDA